jgi:hypothetical protein
MFVFRGPLTVPIVVALLTALTALAVETVDFHGFLAAPNLGLTTSRIPAQMGYLW